jgi:PAS domain S-box-containing protein
MSGRPRILLADSTSSDRELAALLLRGALPEYEVEAVGDPMALAERLLHPDLAAVVTEHALIWGSGLELTATISRLHPNCPVVLFTAAHDADVAADAIRHGVDAYVVKGSSGYLALAGAVREALERAERRRVASAGEAHYRTLIEEMPVGIFTLSPDGTIREASPAAAHLLRAADSGALVGASLPALLADEGNERLRRLLAAGTAVRGLEAEVARTGAERAWVRISAWPVAEVGRPVARWEGSLEDVSGYKLAERQLEERAAQLSRSNAELQQFSYVISHDLQEPLQLLTRYAQLLGERYSGRLEAEAHRWLAHVLTSAARMQAMINDVLEYARVETRGEPFTLVDLDAVVAEAVGNLKVSIDESGAVVSVGELPRIPADGRQMAQVLQNLIGNAVKFRGPRPPRVQVSAVEAEDAWVVAVMDNGIGIQSEHLDRIFGMFQRLHSPADYPGTGIGLAICKRIVERHGGQIWATSQPGEGSTFYFSIPKRGPAAATPETGTEIRGEHGRKAAARTAG